MWQPLGKIIKDSTRRSPEGVQRRIEAAVLNEARIALREVFGPERASRLRPGSFSDGVLRIVCPDREQARETARCRPELLRRLNAEPAPARVRAVTVVS